MKGAVRREVWETAQSGHLETWRGYHSKGIRHAPERAEIWRGILLEVSSCAQIRPGERVLDIGCGLDSVLDFIDEVEGFTLDSLMARLVQFGLSPKLRHTAATFESLPFADQSFDRVFLMNVLDHVRDPAAGVGEIARVLRPGGQLILSVDTYAGRRYRQKRLRKWWDRTRGARTKHPWVFSVPDVQRLLHGARLSLGPPTHVKGTKERRALFIAAR